MIFDWFPRAGVEIIIGTTVLVDYLIYVFVRCIKVTLVVCDDLLLYSINNQRNLDLNDPWDLNVNGVFFLLLAGRLIVGHFRFVA